MQEGHRSTRAVLARLDRLPDKVLLFAPFAVAVAFTFFRTADDPLITIRYALNVIHGHGAVFNIGERVEGFTSPLHLAVVVAAVAVPGGHYLLRVKLLSLVFAVLALLEGCKLLAAVDPPRWARRAGLVVLALSFPFVSAASNGLETSLTCWLLTALLVRLTWADRNRAGAAVYASALALARPDALLVLAALGVTGIYVERARPLWRRVKWLVAPLATAGIYEAFRLVYYREPLPNTYYAKRVSIGSGIPDGLRYIAESIQRRATLPPHGMTELAATALFVVQALLIVVGCRALIRADRRRTYIVAAVVAQLVFVVFAGGDWMFGGRFLAPVSLLMAVAEVCGLVAVMAYRVHRSPWYTAVVATVAAALVFAPYRGSLVPVWRTGGRTDDRSIVAEGGYPVFSDLWVSAPDLFRCAPKGSTVAFSEVGYAGIARQDLHFLDLRGLTDDRIAHNAPAGVKHAAGVEDPNWYLDRSAVAKELMRTQPVLILSFDGKPPTTILGATYELIDERSFGPANDAKTLRVFRRADAQC